MIHLQKFYNADAQESAAAIQTETTTAEPAPQAPAPSSAAEALAKFGQKTNLDKPYVDKAVEIPGDEKPNATEKPSTATVTEPNVEEKSDSPTPTTEVKQEETQKSEPVNNLTWQEQLKTAQVQPDEVLKELGVSESVVNLIKGLNDVDPKMAAFLEIWKSGGDLKGYLQEMTLDYSKMDDESLMRHKLRSQYPEASEGAINTLYAKEVIAKYGLDSEEEGEAEVGKELLALDAKKLRQEYIQKQQEKLLPPPPVKDDTAQKEAALRAENEQKQFFSDWMVKVKESPLTKSMYDNKTFVFGEGDDRFAYPVEPSEVEDMLYNAEKYSSAIWGNENGKRVPNVERQLLIGLVAKYGKDVFNKLAEHYQAVGSKKAIDPIENAKPVESTTLPGAGVTQPKTAAEYMAAQGVRNTGGVR